MAVAEGLAKLHSGYYMVYFPNLKYPIQDHAIAEAYLGASIMLGPDICLPDSVTPGELAAAVDRYARLYPQRVKSGMFDFIAEAFGIEYGCGPKHPRH
jgi:hypothetical protein